MDSQPDDALLMNELAMGREAALGELMRRWEGHLRCFIERMCGSPNWTDEVWQDIWTRVYVYRKKYDTRRPFRPFLFTVALNACRSARGRWKGYWSGMVSSEALGQWPAAEIDPANSLASVEEAGRLHEATCVDSPRNPKIVVDRRASEEENPTRVGSPRVRAGCLRLQRTRMSGKRYRQLRQASNPTQGAAGSVSSKLARLALPFAYGVILTGGAFLLFSNRDASKSGFGYQPITTPEAGRRSVAQLVALADAELEKVDILEMNIAVAKEMPGLDELDYGHYRQILDGWTAQFRAWLPTVEHAFREAPHKYKNDINFFRLGMLAQFLDQAVGVAYDEEQKQAQIDERKTGKKVEFRYTNPGDLLLHGLIDAKRGTCATMPTLHVAIGRRMGWPVGLACAESHFVCRYDDGNVVYNIEATDTGRGGFADGSDKDYMEKEGVSPKAIACGSDLRKLTAREMLGVFVSGRARVYGDTGKLAQADRDYALAYLLFPRNRKIYMWHVGILVEAGTQLFAPNELGYPTSLAGYIVTRYGSPFPAEPPRAAYRDALAEAERMDRTNRANLIGTPPHGPQPLQPPQPPTPGGRQPPARPGGPQPYQPPGYPQQPQPVR